MKVRSIETFSVLVLGITFTLAAQVRVAGGWQNVGSAHVDGRADHDRIDAHGEAYTALRLGVSGGAVEFERLAIHFRNGGDEVLPVAVRVPSGGMSPAIPLLVVPARSTTSKSGTP